MNQTIGNFLIGLLYALIVATILVATMFVVNQNKNNQVKVFLGGQEVVVMVANTALSQKHGLSGREKLGINEGMLFIFEKSQQYGFWMKDMRFSIDIIYFDKNHRIVDVWENANPESYPKIFTPSTPSQFVLEVPAGFFTKHKLKKGEVFEISK